MFLFSLSWQCTAYLEKPPALPPGAAGRKCPALRRELNGAEWVDSEEKWKSQHSYFPPTALTPPRRH